MLIVAGLALLAWAAFPATDVRAQRAQPAQSPAESWLLRPQQVFDATSEQAHPGWVVLVTGNRIVAVGPAADAWPPVRVAHTVMVVDDEAIVRDFIRAVRERRPPAVTGEDARLTTELILRIYGAAGK